MSQIVINAVSKDFRVANEAIAAVRNVSLVIERGNFVSIVGHSGSGKTSVTLIGGMVSPTSGRVLFNRDTWTSDRLSEYRCEKVGFMFQSASCFRS